MNTRKWLILFFTIVTVLVSILGGQVLIVDPYFHFHKPFSSEFYYELDNQRSQNDGITRHFDYNALITGTSMTENFKTSEADTLFNSKFVKIPFSGAPFKELNDAVTRALNHNPETTVVIRGLDMGYFAYDSDFMRHDQGWYPTYLYDNNPFNDIEYILNRDVFWKKVLPMETNSLLYNKHGITSFDEYSRWQERNTFGKKTALPEEFVPVNPSRTLQEEHLTEPEKAQIIDNVTINLTNIADEHPNTDFYYFLTPYSIIWWNDLLSKGGLTKQLETEELVCELLLSHDNIHYFSFNTRIDIVSDLNNYKDPHHYASWINSLILKWMKEGKYQLKEENYKDYLTELKSLYESFNYSSIELQEDYDSDYFAAALLDKELVNESPKLIEGTVLTPYPYNYLAFDYEGEAVNSTASISLIGTADEKCYIHKDVSCITNLSGKAIIDISSNNNTKVIIQIQENGCSISNITLY